MKAMKTIVMPLLTGALVAIVPLLASAKLDGRCFGDGSAIALKAILSDAGDSKASQAETQEQRPEDAPLDATENMLSEPSEDDVPEQLADAESAAAQEVESMVELVQAAEPSMEQAAPQTAAAELQTEPVQVQAQELAAESESAPAAEPEPAPAPTPAYGAIPFELAAQTGTWWGIDSSDSAYWAVQENINAMRAAGGLPALSVDGGLSAIASARCQSFVEGGPFDHSGMVTTSEICAAGPLGSASAVCAAWQNSPDHYANIMRTDITSMGIACWFCSFEGNNYTYWTVTFS